MQRLRKDIAAPGAPTSRGAPWVVGQTATCPKKGYEEGEPRTRRGHAPHGEGRGGGTATYCATPDTCVSATSGTVTFTEYEHGVKAVGTYTITLLGGEVLWGTLDASWCEVELWCG